MATVTFGAEYAVNPGKDDVLVSAVRDVIEILEKTPGHSQTRLYQDTADPHSYLIYSEWEDEGAFKAFMQSEAFASAKSWGRAGILARAPRHRVYSRTEEKR